MDTTDTQSPQIPEQNFLATKDVSVPAGDSQRIAISFSRLIVLEASASFMARLDDGEEFPLDLGLKLNLGSRLVQRITIRNTSATDTLTVRLWHGTADFSDARLNVVATRPNQFVQFGNAPTTLVPATEQSLAAAATKVFSATNALYSTRKALIVCNLDPVESLSIYSGATKCGVIFPQTSIILETGSAITIKNESAVTVSFNALELWYAKWS